MNLSVRSDNTDGSVKQVKSEKSVEKNLLDCIPDPFRKPRSAYTFFMIDFNTKNPGSELSGIREVWTQMGNEEKLPFVQMEEEDKVQIKREKELDAQAYKHLEAREAANEKELAVKRD